MLANVGKVAEAQCVADRIAIAEILALHSRGLDRLEEATLKSCYWPDADVDYGTFVGSAHQFAELVMQALSGVYELTRHCIGNTLIAYYANGRAKTESTVNAAHLFSGAKQEMQFSGRYLDTLEKRDGVWKMLHRRVVIDWCRTVAVVDERDTEAFAAMAKGAHSEADPSHSHFSNN